MTENGSKLLFIEALSTIIVGQMRSARMRNMLAFINRASWEIKGSSIINEHFLLSVVERWLLWDGFEKHLRKWIGGWDKKTWLLWTGGASAYSVGYFADLDCEPVCSLKLSSRECGDWKFVAKITSIHELLRFVLYYKVTRNNFAFSYSLAYRKTSQGLLRSFPPKI